MTEKRRAYRNFDEFLNEPEEICFTYRGKDWTLPGSVPMVKLFEIYEMQDSLQPSENGQPGSDELEVMKKVTKLLMGDLYEEFESTVHAPHALEIMTWLMGEVMGKMEDGMPDPEEIAGKATSLQDRLKSQRKRTSTTGKPSRQTSEGFTLSPIPTSAS